MNSFIIISELEVFYRVGVPDEERAKPQRLLLSLEIGHDFSAAAESDDIKSTIDYYSVCERLRSFGEGREWRLIETLASDIGSMILDDFKAAKVQVEVRKFIIPDTSYVAVKLARARAD